MGTIRRTVVPNRPSPSLDAIESAVQGIYYGPEFSGNYQNAYLSQPIPVLKRVEDRGYASIAYMHYSSPLLRYRSRSLAKQVGNSIFLSFHVFIIGVRFDITVAGSQASVGFNLPVKTDGMHFGVATVTTYTTTIGSEVGTPIKTETVPVILSGKVLGLIDTSVPFAGLTGPFVLRSDYLTQHQSSKTYKVTPMTVVCNLSYITKENI